MSKKNLGILIGLMVIMAIAATATFFVIRGAQADEFTEEDKERWQKEYMSVVQKGRELWVSAELGKNEVSCAQCHPNAANTHPETYPKFQQQLGKVIPLREMINWCLQHPLEGDPLKLDDPKMIAIEAYVHHERRGTPLAPGKH